MISRRTVFILGAGASVAYGMPSGADLIKMMMAGRKLPDDIRTLLHKEFLCDTPKLDELAGALRAAAPMSIDFFLSKHNKFADIGRAIIAHRILVGERDSNLLNAHPTGDWLKYVYQLMLSATNNAEDFGKNRVSFITFNYDRTVERTLHLRLSAMYPDNKAALMHALSAIPIVHVHGDLGTLPERDDQKGEPTLLYGAADIALRTLAPRIRLVGEHDGEGASFRRARVLLSQAEVVIFLGFGFHAENIENLRPKEWFLNPASRLYATTFGMEGSEPAVARARLPRRRSNDIHLESLGCLDFLRHHAHALAG